jgi:hypothetical protein
MTQSATAPRSILVELSPYFTPVILDEADTQLDVHVTEVEEGRLVLTES